ncbi:MULTISPECIES: HutD family protein [unclassified Aureimonas]|uniref:HutD/Ves family protein n=1 Tax=unclassified Aureimonas TaxID=2615206 RepID=UPI0006FB9620|nr:MULTISPECIES: HutD family protein [unclassified Aureimonas]KQT69893.1 hypothetical protein ASG62_01960 [Aureimonas sp. Leaf427]KQT75953.1 hypothetical protein ASG54_14260 [Aureimonas sp. Leaf460]
MRLLPAAGHRRMPWKNGGGETIEIAVYPEGAGLDAFDWRVSMAIVAGDGPFSVFPGIDRTLAIVEGEGMVLDIEGLGRHRLTCETAPLPFPADAPTSARLEDGAITDLNVMTRRGVRAHRVTRLDAQAPARIEAETGWRLVVALGAMVVSNGREELELSERDVVLLEGPGTIGLSIPSASRGGYLVTIE